MKYIFLSVFDQALIRCVTELLIRGAGEENRSSGYESTLARARLVRHATRGVSFVSPCNSIWDQPIKYSVGTAVNQATFAPKDIVLYPYMKYLANLQEMAEI